MVVNTCGFIDSAKAESLEAIGEALAENGKVIVTGCMGVEESVIRNVHPSVLAVTGPQQYEEVVRAVHNARRPRKTTIPTWTWCRRRRQAHAAPLCLPEDLRRLQSSLQLLHHPSMRGDLVSRPVGDVLSEAERLVKAGVKELLVISQDTSAYGVDMKFRSGFWNGRPVKTRMTELCTALSEMGVWTRLHYVSLPARRRDHSVDGRRQGAAVPGHSVPARQPAHPEGHEASGLRGQDAGAREALARECPDLTIRSTFIVGFPGETEEDFQYLLDWMQEAQLDRVGCFQYSPVEGAPANLLDNPCRTRSSRNAGNASWKQQAISASRRPRSAARSTC